MRWPAERSTFAVATAAVGVAMATGVGAQTGMLDTSPVRWVHHALYGSALTTTVFALATARRRARRAGLLAAVVALVGLSRTRGRTSAHAATASLTALCFVVVAPFG